MRVTGREAALATDLSANVMRMRHSNVSWRAQDSLSVAAKRIDDSQIVT